MAGISPACDRSGNPIGGVSVIFGKRTGPKVRHKDAVKIVAELPGVKPEDVKLSLENNLLLVPKVSGYSVVVRSPFRGMSGLPSFQVAITFGHAA